MAGFVDPREVLREVLEREEAALSARMSADSGRLMQLRFRIARARLRRRLRRDLRGASW